MNEIQQRMEDDMRRLRREALIYRVLHGLRSTIQLRGVRPETPVDEVMADFTDKSVEFIAPVIEAIEILEDIIFASDGCMGHRQCLHSMEPWRRARTLLQGKWELDCGDRRTGPDGNAIFFRGSGSPSAPTSASKEKK